MPSGNTIVLIEDDREIATTIQNVLEGVGYDVHVAQNGVEGRRLIEDQQPDLVITDMMMPKMGGFPVLEFLKSLESPPKIIMITANEGGRHKAYAEMLGVSAYLRKPFAMDVMLESVQDALAENTKPSKQKTNANAGRKQAASKSNSNKKQTGSKTKKKSSSKKQADENTTQDEDATGQSKLRRSARKKSS